MAHWPTLLESVLLQPLWLVRVLLSASLALMMPNCMLKPKVQPLWVWQVSFSLVCVSNVVL